MLSVVDALVERVLKHWLVHIHTSNRLAQVQPVVPTLYVYTCVSMSVTISSSLCRVVHCHNTGQLRKTSLMCRLAHLTVAVYLTGRRV